MCEDWVEPLGIEPSPHALQAHVRTSYTKVPFLCCPFRGCFILSIGRHEARNGYLQCFFSDDNSITLVEKNHKHS